MQRIQTADNRFASGNPTLGTPGTIVTAKFLNDVQEEISNVILDAGMELDGEDESQLSDAIKKLIENKSVLVFSTIPTSYLVDVIYVKQLGYLEWQTFGSWSGYASLDVAEIFPSTSPIPRTRTIDAIGDIYSKAEYPALWARANMHGQVVPAAQWKTKEILYADVGNGNFKVPDLRNQFIRFTGTDVDIANARVLGSAQEDALQNIVGTFDARAVGQTSGDGSNALIPRVTGAFTLGLSTKTDHAIAYRTPTTMQNNDLVTFNASRSVRASSETRVQNTALAPRIFCY